LWIWKSGGNPVKIMTEAQKWMIKWIHLPRWARTDDIALFNFLVDIRMAAEKLFEKRLNPADRNWIVLFKDSSSVQNMQCFSNS
jgi:hypothetical protein